LRVAVLLLNRNQWDLTRQCLDSLYQSEGGVEVVPLLIDQASDTTPGWLSEYPGLRFRRFEQNSGFTGGNNRAFHLMEPGEIPYTFVLNNDATVRPDTVARLVGFLEKTPSAGVTSPSVFYACAPDTVWSAGGTFTPSRMIFDQRVWPTRASLPREPLTADFATGCAMMMRTEDYRRFHGFREDMFMYFEDAELCWRMRKAGMEIWLVPDAEVYHHVSVSSGGIYSPFAVYYSLRNRCVFGRELLSPVRFRALQGYLTAMVVAKTFIFAFRGRSKTVPVMWKALFDGFAERMGPRIGVPNPAPFLEWKDQG
jgi:hypothetical protein